MKKKIHLLTFSILCLVGLLSFQNFTVNNANIILPDFPLLNIDNRTLTRNANGLYETQTPHLPIHEMSLDGRIGIRKRDDPTGIPLFILKPERVFSHLGHLKNDKVGANLMDAQPNAILNLREPSIREKIFLPKSYRPGRSFFCEKTEKKSSPYICGGVDDCYDLTIVTRFDDGSDPLLPKATLVSLDVTIQVANPKTVNASIRSVTSHLSSIKQGVEFSYPKFAESIVVGDGRLLLFRLGSASGIKLSDGRPADPTNIDIVYSNYKVFDENNKRTEQCDVTKWTPANTHPISHAYYDKVNNMRSRYKFARYPLRDNLGQLVRDGQDIGGSYQWMDRDAANLFFTAGGRDGFYNQLRSGSILTPYLEPSESSYPVPRSQPDIDLFEELGSNTSLIYVAGFWTQGKMILLDGLINNADYNVRIADRNISGTEIPVQRKWQLYSNPPIDQPFENIGGVRELGDAFDTNMYHPHLTPNSSFLGSIENRFQYRENMKPVTPKDLVWHFGSTRQSEEIAFDEYVSPYVLINAEMTAASSAVPTFKASLNYYDGLLNGQKVDQLATPQVLSPSAGQLYFQNAVSQPINFFRPPRMGEPIGNIRMEPIAKGGIHGKGLWLNGNAGLKFSIPEQTGMTFPIANAPLYISVFIDPREEDLRIKEHPLLSLTSGEKILLAKTVMGTGFVYDTVVLRDAVGTKISELKLDNFGLRNQKWVNIGIKLSKDFLPTLYLDGFYFKRFEPAAQISSEQLKRFFKIMDIGTKVGPPAIFLGSSSLAEQSTRGWFDDFKVVLRAPSSEEICNYARGTLANIDAVTEQQWIDKAKIYPLDAQSKFKGDSPQVSGNTFLCITRYGGTAQRKLHADPLFSHFKNLPSGAVSIREDILLKSKDLRFGSPRPDFTTNKFCLSCHLPETPSSFAEMDTRALIRNAAVNLEDDLRRQPIQPPRLFRGVVPANYFGLGKPATTLYQNESKVDQWVEVP